MQVGMATNHGPQFGAFDCGTFAHLLMPVVAQSLCKLCQLGRHFE